MTILIAIIYATFISLGLPDTVVGAAWPSMAPDLGADLASAGFISMTTTFCTIISSFSSGYLLKRFGTYKVAAASILLTSVSLMGYAMAPSFAWFIVLTVPLGLGGGAIDAAMNSFAAVHFSARHLNFLHACWGVGASLGPLIVGFFLNRMGEWRPAYWVIAGIQFVLFLVFLTSKKQWDAALAQDEAIDEDAQDSNDSAASDSEVSAVRGPYAVTVPWYKIPNIFPAFLAFFCYSAIEIASGLWSATFLTEQHGLPKDIAAVGTGVLFLGVTVGRFLSGILSGWLSNITLLRLGFTISAIGVIGVATMDTAALSITSFALIGLGFAPVYPTIIKETSRRFGAHNTSRIMGMQMGFAYLGQTTLPPIMGFLITRFSPMWFPALLLFGVIAVALLTEYVERSVRAREARGGVER